MNAGRFFIGVMGLLAALSLGSFADGLSAPRITLTAEDQPLAAVLERIAEQTGVSIVMTNEAAGRESISMRVRNAELENALDQALGGYNYTLSFSAEQNVISKVVIAVQEKKEGVAMLASFPAVQVTGNRSGGSVAEKALAELKANGLEKHAEAYRNSMVAKQKPMAYPEGFTSADIEVMRQGMAELTKKVK